MKSKFKDFKKFGLVALMLMLVAGIFVYMFMSSQPPDEEVIKSVLVVEDERLSKGDPNAPVKMVEYVDMLCPNCARIHEFVMPKIESNYLDNNKIYYEMRFIGKLHPDSERAARGAYCAAEQDKFWEYLDESYSRSWRNFYALDKDVEDVDIFREDKIGLLVSSSGINKTSWNVCMGSDKYRDVLRRNEAKLDELQAYGTPHFILNGTSYNGGPPYEVFQVTIDDELKKAGVN